MDARQVIGWLVPVVIRGIAWILAAKLGYDAAAATDTATQAGSALGALALVALSIYTSIKGRKKLLETPAPGQNTIPTDMFRG